MQITSIGIDLGKATFHLVALGEHGKVRCAKEVLAQLTVGLHRKAEKLSDRHGGMFGCAFPRRSTARPGT